MPNWNIFIDYPDTIPYNVLALEIEFSDFHSLKPFKEEEGKRVGLIKSKVVDLANDGPFLISR